MSLGACASPPALGVPSTMPLRRRLRLWLRRPWPSSSWIRIGPPSRRPITITTTTTIIITTIACASMPHRQPLLGRRRRIPFGFTGVSTLNALLGCCTTIGTCNRCCDRSKSRCPSGHRSMHSPGTTACLAEQAAAGPPLPVPSSATCLALLTRIHESSVFSMVCSASVQEFTSAPAHTRGACSANLPVHSPRPRSFLHTHFPLLPLVSKPSCPPSARKPSP